MFFNLKAFLRESRFMFKETHIVGILIAALLLSIFSIWSGLEEVEQQNQTIDRLIAADKIDRESEQKKQGDYGSAAYYSFHLTYDRPSNLAFAALGDRDVFPWKHRIRMLALEGQIYERDTQNPELAQVGKIDFAFLISVLTPLLIILMLHDLKAVERNSGRYDLLVTTAQKASNLWMMRAFVRTLALFVCLILPFWIGAVVAAASLASVLLITLMCVAYVLFWAMLSVWISNKPFSAPRLASALLGIWLVTTFVIPVIGDEFIEHEISSPNGGDIVLTQREAVNGAWDLPHQVTMDAFLLTHPEWEGKTKTTSLFEWKWYYAFQQVGDEKASELSKAYRDAVQEKYDAAGIVSLLSPSSLFNRALTRVANTDVNAALAYENKIRNFHASLRNFYYPLLFNNTEYSLSRLNDLPKFDGVDTKVKSQN